MKPSAIQALRRKLAADEPVLGLWVTLESPSVTEIAVGLGLDWVIVDAEHGQLDWKEIAEHLRTTARSQTVALVRLTDHKLEATEIKLVKAEHSKWNLGFTGMLIGVIATLLIVK